MSLFPLLLVRYVVVSAVFDVLCRCFRCYWCVMSLFQLLLVLCRCIRGYWCVMSLYPLLLVCYVVVSAVIGVNYVHVVVSAVIGVNYVVGSAVIGVFDKADGASGAGVVVGGGGGDGGGGGGGWWCC